MFLSRLGSALIFYNKLKLFYSGLFCLIVLFTGCTSHNPEIDLEIERLSMDSTLMKPEVDSLFLKIKAIKAAKIDSFFHRKFSRGQFNGTVLFAEKGKVIYENMFGYADFKAKDTLGLNSTFQLASVSKPLTALAILVLKDKKKLDFDEDIRKYFPDFPYEGITIRLLLTHRSGLPEYTYFADEFWPDRNIPITNQDVICLMINKKPGIYYKPDYRYNYTNTNYCILAAIVEKVSKLPFNVFMESQIFCPLGMNNSFVHDIEAGREDSLRTTGYIRHWRKADNTYLNGVVGDKGVFSTVEDLFKLDQALYTEKLICKSTMEEAFIPAHKDLYDHDNYGYGWRLNVSQADHLFTYHTGWWKGFRTYFIREVKEKKTIIVLSNTNNFLRLEDLENLI